MLSLLKEQLKTNVELSTRMFDENIERNLRFANEVLSSTLESSKKLRSSKNIGEAVDAQMNFVKEVQSQVTTFNNESTTALKELRDSATEFASKIKESTSSK